jgi:hypothetical protein
MLTAQKSFKQNNSEKNHIPGEVFSLYFFASGLSPYNDAFLTYSAKSTKKSKNPGHKRPRLWKYPLDPLEIEILLPELS